MASPIADDSSVLLPSFIDRRATSSIRTLENLHETAGYISTTSGEKDWTHVVSLCCKLDIPIFNPPLMAIATRSARSNARSSIVRHVPLDLRGFNVVQKKCKVSHNPLGALQLDISTALRELQILRHPALSKHENIINLVGVTWEEELPEYNLGLNPALLLDFADLGTLGDVLQQEQPLSFQDKVEVCYDVGQGLSSLHEYGIIHGDVKAENVLVRSRGERKWIAKLADFDLSLIGPKTPQRLPGRTIPWNAPESEDSVDLCLCCLKLTDIYS
jgi:serine/threonine protein kinase